MPPAVQSQETYSCGAIDVMVRALGTNTLRVAKNATAFLKKAEAALGFPIEVIAGREEARLIYLGVAHSLPVTDERRLVVDIGGGSTEFIIGEGHRPQRLDSLYMGCVSFSRQFFRDNMATKVCVRSLSYVDLYP